MILEFRKSNLDLEISGKLSKMDLRAEFQIELQKPTTQD